jgi:tetratricopeptide (TPR) repeat protein
VVDYFQVFGVKRNASDREIKDAYRALAKKYHPDPHPGDPESERHMQAINEAKAVLFDPVLREEHRVALRMRETMSAERIEELRRNSRFQGTTTYAPPPPRRPRSKWDKRWKQYTFGIIALLILVAAGIISYKIASSPRGLPTDPIKDIIGRYRESNSNLLTDSLGASPALTAADTITFPDDSAPKLRRMGDILFSLGEYRSAAKYYEMYLKKAPENDTIIGNLSYAYFKEGRYAQTLQILSRQMHGDSNLVVAYYTIGELFLKEDKPFDARDAFLASVHIADSMSRAGRHPPDDARRAKAELARIP